MSKKNYFYVKKLHESRDIFKDRSWLFQSYRKLLERFYFGIYREILLYFPMLHIHMLRKEIFILSTIPCSCFRVWNHLFLCCRSQYERNICLFCTKIRLKNKKVVKAICKTLKVDCFDCVSPSLIDDVIIRGDVNLFIHSRSQDRQKLYNSNNFGTLFYEVISSPLSLQKFYLDVLARVVFNHYDKFILPSLISGLDISEYRHSNVCTIDNSFSFKKLKVREVVFFKCH